MYPGQLASCRQSEAEIQGCILNDWQHGRNESTVSEPSRLGYWRRSRHWSGLGSSLLTPAGAAVAVMILTRMRSAPPPGNCAPNGMAPWRLVAMYPDEDAVAHVVEQTISKFGQLDIAFNHVGIQVPVPETADARARISTALLQSICAGSATRVCSARYPHQFNTCRATDTPMVANALADEPDTRKAVMKKIPLSRLARPGEIATASFGYAAPARDSWYGSDHSRRCVHSAATSSRLKMGGKRLPASPLP